MSVYFRPNKEVDALLKNIRTYFGMVPKKEIVLQRKAFQILLNAIPENQRRHYLTQIPFEGGIIKSN